MNFLRKYDELIAIVILHAVFYSVIGFLIIQCGGHLHWTMLIPVGAISVFELFMKYCVIEGRKKKH